jgi:glycosyltransferase involved in cell wall biosynthesis
VGAVDDAAKNELLGGAAAMLFPIEWEEPFGIVMAEALACGTPVIGMRRGAVPEVIEDGQTGFVCDSVDEMVQAVARLPELQRNRCRAAAEERFSSQVIVDQYEQLYRDALNGRRTSNGRR